MAVKGFSGLPGSGKSYRVVWDLLRLDWSRYLVVHNIDGLKPEEFQGALPGLWSRVRGDVERGPSLELRTYDQVAETLGVSVEDIFSKGHQEAYCSLVAKELGRQVIVIIDEAQTILGSADPGILEWLTYHRHLDQDVWLVTQNFRNIHRSYRVLIELEIKGKKGPVFPFFAYVHRCEGEKIGFSRCGKSKRVFRAYKSFDLGEGKTGGKSYLLPAVALVGVAALVYGFWIANGGMWAAELEAAEIPSESLPVAVGTSASSRRASGAAAGATEAVEVDPFEGWRWAGRVRGVDMIHNGEEMVRLSSVFPSCSVLREDRRRRVLFLLDEVRGLVPLPAGSVQVVGDVVGMSENEYGGRLGGRPIQSVFRPAMWVWVDG